MIGKRLDNPTAPSKAIIPIAFVAVPITIALSLATKDAVLPHLPGQGRTWNIQYLLLLAVAIAAGSLALVFRKRIGSYWCWALVFWNSLWAALAVYATFSLWGEKF